MGLIKDILYKSANKRFLKLFKNQTIFPYYHLVSNESLAHIENLYPYKDSHRFCADIEALTFNYKKINPLDLLSGNIEKNSFLLTFDDGLREVYSVIHPVLKKNNIKAIFFINPAFVDNNEGLYKHYLSIIISHLRNTNFKKPDLDNISQLFSFSYNTKENFVKQLLTIKYSEKDKINTAFKLLDFPIEKYLRDNKLYLSKVEIQEMVDYGHCFGGHTMSHPPLNQLSHEEQKKEIIESIEWLKKNFNIDYSMFAFPFSDKSVSKKLISELFEYDNKIILFGNSGIKKDIHNSIYQRFSLDNPEKQLEKMLVTENLYKLYNIFIGKYLIKRK